MPIADLNGVPLGYYTYVLNVTDALGCSDLDTVVVNKVTGPQALAGSADTLCTGGSIQLGVAPNSAVNGVTPYSYLWTPSTNLSSDIVPMPIADLNGVPLGYYTYVLNVTDALGCSDLDTVVVNKVTGPQALAGSADTLCTGGSIQLGVAPNSAVNGVTPYSYLWTPSTNLSSDIVPMPIADLNGVPLGYYTYVLNVTDALGCSDLDTVVVNKVTGPQALAGSADTLCTGGSIQLGVAPNSAVNGVTPYSYLWTPSTNLSSDIVPMPIADLNGVPLGYYMYVLNVTDALGCSDLDTVVVNKVTGPQALAGSADTLCTGGSIQLGVAPNSAVNGVTPYSYLWTPSTNLSSDIVPMPIADLNGVPLGYYTYVLNVTDALGCSDLDTVVVNKVTGPFAEAGFGSDTLCSGGALILGGNPTATSGVAPYTYNWVPAYQLVTPGSANPITYTTVDTTYVLYLSDALGCVDLDTVFVRYDQMIVDAGGDTLCNGGSMPLGGNPTAQGGTMPYDYQWSPNIALSSDSVSNPFTFTTSLTTYYLTVTDVNGCTNFDTVVVRYNYIGADAGGDTVCTGGSIQLGGDSTLLGGTPSYDFNWTPSTHLNDSVAYNPVYTNTSTSPSTDLYVLIVTDAEGCIDYDSTVVQYNPGEPMAQAGDSSVCTSQSIILGGNPTGSGSFPPFMYAWIPSMYLNDDSIANPVYTNTSGVPDTNTYVLEVKDALGCIDLDTVVIRYNPGLLANAGDDTTCSGGTAILGGPTTGGIMPYQWQWYPANLLLPGHDILEYPYTTINFDTLFIVMATDASGCSDIDSTWLNFRDVPHAEAGFGGDSICTGGTVILGGTPTADLGTAPYTYQWTPSIYLNNDTIANPFASGITSSQTYEVVVRDSLGCMDVDSVTVWYYSKAPIADAGGDTICSGGTVVLGGNPTQANPAAVGPFTYTWLPSTYLYYDSIPNPICVANTDIQYTLIIIGTLGCTDIDSVFVDFDPTGPHAEAGFGDDTICSGGTVLIGGSPTASGGVGPYTYVWSPNYQINDISIANPVTTTHVDTTYVVFVEDSRGCRDLDSVFIDFNPLGPWADAGGINDTICSGGTVIIGGDPTAAGGVAPYIYDWDPSTYLNSDIIANPVCTSNEPFFTYVLFLEDAIGCRDIDTITVAYDPFGPKAEAGWGYDTICLVKEQVLGNDPTVSGGTSPYIYTWWPDYELQDADDANPLCTTPVDTMYVLQVQDANYCFDIDTVWVDVQDLEVTFLAYYQDDVAPEEVEFNNTSVGGNVWDWDFGDGAGDSIENPIHLYTTGGEITVTLIGYTDETKLCSDTFRYTIILYPPSQMIVPNVITPNSDGLNDFFKVEQLGVDEFRCVIYNRWGTELYSFDELNNSWDGRTYSGVNVPEGTYFYIITATGIDKKEFNLNGYFTILRDHK